MASYDLLPTLLGQSARSRPGHVAIEDHAGTISYQHLNELSDGVRDRLRHLGVGPGDRVGLYLRKSIESVTAIFGILKAGAAYVPVDPDGPPVRHAYIFNDCKVKAIIVDTCFVSQLSKELHISDELPTLFVLDGCGGGTFIDQALQREQARDPVANVQDAATGLDDLAYILYTSGSTGKPKGVMLTHRNAMSFIDWCSDTFQPHADDRFSSHAPFHFDLSILDLYLPIKHGATLILIGEQVGKDPLRLAPLISQARISVWYSTPSVLSAMVKYGNMANHDYSALRTIFFAGEVFPVKHLRALKSFWPSPSYFNLYGPTETNVCTWYEIPARIPEDRVDPFPIGKVCSHLHAMVVDAQGHEVDKGSEGELCICGPGVMAGYWNRPEQTEKAFLPDRPERWYRTGDLVTETDEGIYIYVGRRDRMVKRRGYRVELGEIESALYTHPMISEAAVIAKPDQNGEIRIKAFVVFPEARASIVELKRYCSERLPLYMVPDTFSTQPSLPKTSTDKTDYQRLIEMA